MINTQEAHYKNSLVLTSNQYGLTIPATIYDKPVSDAYHNAVVRMVAKRIAKISGGVTIRKQSGAYVAENGDLIEEKSTYIFAYGSSYGNSELIDAIIDIAHVVGKNMKQDSMLVVLDSDVKLLNNWGQ